MLVNKEYVVLKAGVQVGLKTKVYNNRVVMAVYVGIYSVKTLEDLAQETGEAFGEGYTWGNQSVGETELKQ